MKEHSRFLLVSLAPEVLAAGEEVVVDEVVKAVGCVMLVEVVQGVEEVVVIVVQCVEVVVRHNGDKAGGTHSGPYIKFKNIYI